MFLYGLRDSTQCILIDISISCYQSHKFTEHSKQKKHLDERKYYTSIYIQIVKKIKHIITHSHTYTHPDIYTLP